MLRSFRERLLGPLLAYDDQHRAELLPTLREFLACSGSWNACAAKMYVHVNTVRYRIRRIEELTGGVICPAWATRWTSSSPCGFARFARGWR